MGKCLQYECKSSWDVKYAVEYGSVICKKAVGLFSCITMFDIVDAVAAVGYVPLPRC